MHRVIFQFKSATDLQSFFELCKDYEAEVHLHTFTMLCHCEEREIELAINGFDAQLVHVENIGN